jgi:hypothetical protein
MGTKHVLIGARNNNFWDLTHFNLYIINVSGDLTTSILSLLAQEPVMFVYICLYIR